MKQKQILSRSSFRIYRSLIKFNSKSRHHSQLISSSYMGFFCLPCIAFFIDRFARRIEDQASISISISILPSKYFPSSYVLNKHTHLIHIKITQFTDEDIKKEKILKKYMSLSNQIRGPICIILDISLQSSCPCNCYCIHHSMNSLTLLKV